MTAYRRLNLNMSLKKKQKYRKQKVKTYNIPWYLSVRPSAHDATVLKL